MAENRANIRVRRMTNSDLAKVNEVDRSLIGRRRVTTWPFSFDTYWRVYEPKINFVAELDGRVVGFITGVIEQEERSYDILSHPRPRGSQSAGGRKVGWVELMGVHADHWGKGAGMALMNAFADECKKNKATVRIVVRDDDEDMKNFLLNIKFKRSEVVAFEKAPE